MILDKLTVPQLVKYSALFMNPKSSDDVHVSMLDRRHV
jgi:hypothetical protein